MAKSSYPIDQTAIQGLPVDQLINTKFSQIVNAVNGLVADVNLLSIPPATEVLGGYDPTTDTCGDTGLPLNNTEYKNGDSYVVSEVGNMPADPQLGNGAAVAPGDTIYFIEADASWLVISGTTAYLSSVNPDTAAGHITFEQGANSAIPATLQSDFIRKIESEQGDTDARAYADAQDAAHVAHADPHTQYVERQEAVDTFVLAAYGGVQAVLPIDGGPTSIGAAWTPLTFDMVVQPAIPKYFTVDAANGTLQAHFNGMYAVAITVAFEHNSSNSGRTTNIRVYNVTQGIGGAGVVVGTGRNAEATSFSGTILYQVVNDNDVFRIEIGNGDSYTAIDWNAVAFQMWSVGPFTGTLGSDTQYADIDVDALMAPSIADIPTNDNKKVSVGVLRRLIVAIIDILKKIEARHD